MPKKSKIKIPEVRRWLDKVKYAERKRDDADERFGYSRSLKEYAGDYASALPSFMLGVPIVPINEVYGYVKAFIPSVYSRNPRVCFNPHGARSVAPSKLVELGVNAYWNELRLKRQIRRCTFDAIFAEGWMKTGFSAAFGSIENKDGEIPVESNEFIRNKEIFSTRVSWRHMVRDPDAVDGIHDARFVAQKIIKPLQAVLDSSLYTAKDIRATHTYDPLSEVGKPRKLEGGEMEEFIEFWEIWDADQQKIFWASDGCDEYLRDPEDWPYRFNGYPYDLLRFNQLEDEAYAPNCIMPWEPQLWEKIKVRSMQMDHLKRHNRQSWIKKGTMSKAQQQKYAVGQSGALLEVDGDVGPQPIQYPAIQTDIYAIENRIDLDKDNISGQPNAVRSAPQKTQSRTLGEINTMISAFQARQVDPQSDIEDFCAEIAIKIAAVAQDFLPGDKWVQVTQEDKPAIIQAFGAERFDGNGFKFTREDIAGAEFNVSVDVGSTLPLDRQGRIESMINILKLGANIGIQPGGEVSMVIGKNILSDMEMKEIELAYAKAISDMQRMNILMKAKGRMEQGMLEDKIARAKQAAGEASGL